MIYCKSPRLSVYLSPVFSFHLSPVSFAKGFFLRALHYLDCPVDTIKFFVKISSVCFHLQHNHDIVNIMSIIISSSISVIIKNYFNKTILLHISLLMIEKLLLENQSHVV